MKAAHVFRRPDEVGNKAATKHKRAPAAEAQAAHYPPGFFLALLLQHNWPPRFEPTLHWGAVNMRTADQMRANGGFTVYNLNLQGAQQKARDAVRR